MIRLLPLLLLGCTQTPEDKRRADAEPEIEQVCINELMVASESDPIDEDWVELAGPPGLALDSWSLRWSRDDGEESAFLDGWTIPESGFLLLLPDGDGFGEDTLPFKLDGDGEDLGLRAPDGSEEWVLWTETANDLAHARVTDCCREPDCWTTTWYGTPGESNEPEPEPR